MVKKVHLLDDALINKIAAGEVVERPASVVKELVENAMDAGATRIEVTLEEGGRRRIQIRDNGCGMSPDDAKLALRRHTTSKINSVQDLFQIRTMGFRGEALASISSVSRFTLQTVATGAAEGLRLELADGQLKQQVWNGVAGTQVTVDDLFYNVPARQAFLRNPGTEFSYCAEYLQALALARPDIEIILTHNGREILRAPRRCEEYSLQFGEQILRQRFQDVYPKEAVDQLLYLTAQDKYGSFEAIISAPGNERGLSKAMHTFVNGRWVKDKTLRYGVMRGYHSHLLKGKFPVCALYVSIDPSLIDVNVHPAKTEVRFQYGGELQSLIAMQIRNRLRQGAWARPDLPPLSEEIQSDFSTDNSLQKEAAATAKPVTAPLAATKKASNLPPDFDLSFTPSGNFSALEKDSGLQAASPAKTSQSSFLNRPGSAKDGNIKRTIMSFDGEPGQAALPLTVNPSKLVESEQENYQVPWEQVQYLGTFAKCYLFFELGEQLLVIDQHAFHERILYEQLQKDRSILEQVQPLLVPEVIALAPSMHERLRSNEALYRSLGFDFSFPNDEEVEILALPTLLAKRDPEVLLHDLLNADDATLPDNELTPRLAHEILSTMACHAAVRAGEQLELGEINQLLQQARSIDFYHNCPHGRRVLKWWKKSQIEAWFDR